MWKKIRDFLYVFRKTFLTNYFRIYYSQFGEDVVLKHCIPKSKTDGFYVDVGCFHPKKFSNTHFLYTRGWRGINVDMDEIKIQVFKLARPADINVVAAASDRKEPLTAYRFGKYGLGSTIDESTAMKTKESVVGKTEITARTLDEIIGSTTYRGRQIDLLSIDAEGHDYNVLISLDIDVYKPRLIVIETHIVDDISAVMETDIYKYLTARGYRLFNWVGFSLFFKHPGYYAGSEQGAILHDES